MRKSSSGKSNSLYLLRGNEKLYLSFTIVVQGVLIVIMSTLLLVAMKILRKQKSRILYIAKLLSIHEIAAALIGRSEVFVFLNYDVGNCKVAAFFSSVVVFLHNFNTAIITFISFDRLQQMRLSASDRYQLQTIIKTVNILFIISVFWSVLCFV